MTFIPIELRAGTELRCPYCNSTNLTVSCVHLHLPVDGMVLRFEWPSLTATEIDGGDVSPAAVALAVDCPRCGDAYGQTYLEINDGKTRVGDFVARVQWDTDADVVDAEVNKQRGDG